MVCPDDAERAEMDERLAAPDLELISVGTGGEALAIVKRQYLDGILIHLQTENTEPLQLVEEIQNQLAPHVPPVMLMATRPLTEEEEQNLPRLARNSTIKRANSLERLLDDSVLLMHRAESELRPDQCQTLEHLRRTDAALCGKTVLVVDDDVRNIFALTSLLEEHNLNVLYAENGLAGIELLRTHPGIDLVLMDIMMPGMDGYETIGAIRQLPEFRTLPIVALTAKAMKGDRAKCIEAGASEYITKPVDLEQLFSVLRVSMRDEQQELAQIAMPTV
jgi:CheY-like chemotaxis protein